METSREFSQVVQIPGMPGPSVVTRRNASEYPDQGTAETVARMRHWILTDTSTPEVWSSTRQALRGTDATGKSRQDRCEAIYRWIASHIKFRSDDPVLAHVLGLENELDLLFTPARLLTMSRPAEDCDGFTMLACAMLLCAGVPCEIVTIKADPQEPGRFTHVYCQAILESGQGLVMDCSQGAKEGWPIGAEAPEYFARKTWGVMEPTGPSKGLHGLEDTTTLNYPGMPTTQNAMSGIDWNAIIAQSFKFGSQLALKPGQYVQNAQGVMVSNVPGAYPGQYPGTGYNVGGISSSTILIGVAGLGLILLLGRK